MNELILNMRLNNRLDWSRSLFVVNFVYFIEQMKLSNYLLKSILGVSSFLHILQKWIHVRSWSILLKTRSRILWLNKLRLNCCHLKENFLKSIFLNKLRRREAMRRICESIYLWNNEALIVKLDNYDASKQIHDNCSTFC